MARVPNISTQIFYGGRGSRVEPQVGPMLEDVLASDAVKAVVALALLPAALLAVLTLTVAFLRAITRARPDIEAQEEMKYLRYEAGNQKGEARGKVSMQYLGYLIVFLAVEPALIIMALLVGAAGSTALLKAFAVMAAVYAPLLAYALAEARRIESWMLEG